MRGLDIKSTLHSLGTKKNRVATERQAQIPYMTGLKHLYTTIEALVAKFLQVAMDSKLYCSL